MNFNIWTKGFTLAALFSSSIAYAEPSRTFFSETGRTALKDSISIDLEYDFDNDATGTGIRMGKFGGEVLLNISNAEFAASSVGYKKALQENLSLYGLISHLNDDNRPESFTDIALGIAYTIPLEQVVINLNGEFITDDSDTLRGGDTTLFAKAALLVPFSLDNSPASMIIEIAAENNDELDTGAALGIRWQPALQLTTDFILYADDGNNDATGIPGYIKLNYTF
ncbi:MAG: hypothetical protein QNJ56_10550 [Gammaproteobacteria bacterium]|nr:hypothetical protein [Gammaproteobacteria bacterium]